MTIKTNIFDHILKNWIIDIIVRSKYCLGEMVYRRRVYSFKIRFRCRRAYFMFFSQTNEGKHDTLSYKWNIVILYSTINPLNKSKYNSTKSVDKIGFKGKGSLSPLPEQEITFSKAESRFLEEPRNRVPRKIFMKNRKNLYLSYEMLHFG